jgi:hypothetical protein
MGEESKVITLDNLGLNYKTEEGTTILKSTGSITYSLSKIDTITSLTIPATFTKEFEIKVSKGLVNYFRLYADVIKLQRIYKRVKKYRVKKKLMKRLYEKAYLMYEVSRK